MAGRHAPGSREQAEARASGGLAAPSAPAQTLRDGPSNVRDGAGPGVPRPAP